MKLVCLQHYVCALVGTHCVCVFVCESEREREFKHEPESFFLSKNIFGA